MEKHLRVNTSILDMINTKPETIEEYDEIKINCAMCITTTKTQQFLSKGNININTSNVVQIYTDEEVKVMNINGGKFITAEFEAPKEPTILVVNGGLIIEDSPKKNLDQFKAVVVNGGVLHPMSFDTSNFNVNGALIPYPDGAILTLKELELTNSFIKAAVSGATYYVQGVPSNLSNFNPAKINEVLKDTCLRAVEPLDFELLKSKNIHFYTSWVTTTEDNAEELMKIVRGNIGSTIIPSGYKIMNGGRLDMLAIRRFGKNIYVDGDLKIYEEDAEALDLIDNLYVAGEVRIADSIADVFFKKCSRYGKLKVYKGEWIEVKNSEYTISNELLQDMDNGATFNISSSNVEILPEVTKELLSQKIHEINLKSSKLTLSLEQQKTLTKKINDSISSDISIREFEKIEKEEPKPENNNISNTRINCSYYAL